jgi:cellulose 1,4-beta-cellobiosidase
MPQDNPASCSTSCPLFKLLLISIMLLLLLPFVVSVYSQQAGTLQAEVHPSLTWESCTGAEVCTTVTGSVTLDADWRWTHGVGGDINCYTGNAWNTTLCPDPIACAQNCALEGATYSNFGITTSGNSL